MSAMYGQQHKGPVSYMLRREDAAYSHSSLTICDFHNYIFFHIHIVGNRTDVSIYAFYININAHSRLPSLCSATKKWNHA